MYVSNCMSLFVCLIVCAKFVILNYVPKCGQVGKYCVFKCVLLKLNKDAAYM
jgi:hypothetical protein